MTFAELNLCPAVLKAIAKLGYNQPTPVQQKAIPKILAGHDILCSAQTGTGKTAGFVLPLLEQLSNTQGDAVRAKRVRALILAPTRELAQQVGKSVADYSQFLDLTTEVIVGGVDAEQQKQSLLQGIDLLVATPGRLLDLVHQGAIKLDAIEFFVLDEADRLLDMGFIGDINNLIDRLPGRRQNLLFSATLSDDIQALSQRLLDNPTTLSITSQNTAQPAISQWLIEVDKDKKSQLLSHLIQDRQWHHALIFIRTKHGAAKLVSQLEKRGIRAESIHSGRSQSMRNRVLDAFKSGSVRFLIATGIAARGIDIENLQYVVNYDLPDDADEYIHRIGRTGRAGAKGEAVSLVSRDDFKRLCAIERTQDKIIDRIAIAEFDVTKPLPPSNLNYTSAPSNRTPRSDKKSPRSAPKRNVKPKSKARPTHASASEAWSPWQKKPSK